MLLEPLQEPEHLQVSNHDFIDRLSWNEWDTGAVTATGTYHAIVCEPDCASGHFTEHPVKLSAGPI